MERIIKSLFVIFILICISSPTFAESQPAPAIPQTVTMSQCVKTFNIGFEKLFLLTEVAINANNYTIDEIQSQGGYIVFSVNRYKFVATIFTFGKDKAIIKITPADGNYTFPVTIVKNIFKYIEVNQYKKF